MAGRPKKDPSKRAKRREIQATDAQWAEVKEAAKEADLSIPQFLLRRRGGGGSPIGAARIIAFTEALQGTQAALEALALRVAEGEDVRTSVLLMRLIAMDRRLTELARLGGVL